MSDDAANIFRRFTPDPGTGRKAHFLHAIAYEITRDPIFCHLAEVIRDEFDLLDPQDESDLDHNRRVPREDIRDRVFEAANETQWSGELESLNFILNPHDALLDLVDAFLPETPPDPPNDPDESITPSPEDWNDARDDAYAIADFVARLFLDSGFQNTFADVLVDTLTDHVIEGNLALPRPVPSWFTTNLFEFPFPDDVALVAIISRFTDLNEFTDDLRREHRKLFLSGERDTVPRDADRDLWALTQYHRIKDDADTEDSIYLRLLIVFEESPWKNQLKRYNLDSADSDHEGALDFLRNIVRNQRQRNRDLIEDMVHYRDAPCDE